MKELGITKGKWQHNKHSRGNIECNGRSIANCMGYSTNIGNGEHIVENYANAELVIDAGNTAQKCGLLPSELLRQRDELKEAMKRIMFSSGTLKTVQDIAEAAIKKIEPKAEECSYWKTTGCCLPGCGTDSCEHHPLNR